MDSINSTLRTIPYKTVRRSDCQHLHASRSGVRAVPVSDLLFLTLRRQKMGMTENHLITIDHLKDYGKCMNNTSLKQDLLNDDYECVQ